MRHKVGDKVVLVVQDAITRRNHLKIGSILTIQAITSYGVSVEESNNMGFYEHELAPISVYNTKLFQALIDG